MSVFFFHELRMVLREPRFWVPFLIPPFFLLIVQIWLRATQPEALDLGGASLLTLGALLSTLSVTLTADSFAGERERNTLELLLCLPTSLAKIFLGKLLALLPLPIMLALLSQLLYWWTLEGDSPLLLLQAWAHALSCCLVITAVALLISLRSHTVRSAAQGTLLFVLALLFSTQVTGSWYFANYWAMVVFPLLALSFLGGVTLYLLRRPSLFLS